jgi:hypothetical protein
MSIYPFFVFDSCLLYPLVEICYERPHIPRAMAGKVRCDFTHSSQKASRVLLKTRNLIDSSSNRTHLTPTILSLHHSHPSIPLSLSLSFTPSTLHLYTTPGTNNQGTLFSYSTHASPYFSLHFFTSLIALCTIIALKKSG